VKDEPHGGFCEELACKVCDNFMMRKKPITSKHYIGIAMDDLETDPPSHLSGKAYRAWVAEVNKSIKEVNMSEDETQDFEYQQLYEVITTYGGDRENVVVEKTEVVAENEQRAQMQAKDDIDSSWDIDYVEQTVVSICRVRVKRKPREILKG
jgi:hypothetical protein